MEEHLTAFYDFAPFRLDVRERLLLRNGERVSLTPRTFDTLLMLVRNRDRVVEKNELMDTLWPDSDVEENNLNQSISAVRKALGEKPGEQKYIKTVTRRGYRFVADVAEVQVDNVGLAAEQRDEVLISAKETAGVTNRSETEVPLAPGATRFGQQPGRENKRRLLKPLLTFLVVLGFCVMLGIVALRVNKEPEETHTKSSNERVERVNPDRGKVEIEVWWPKNGVRISGTHPFKAIVRELSLPEYTMYWQVDGDRLNPLANNYEEYPHKEVLVDLSGWKWRGDGPYAVNFVARDANGNSIAERRVDIYVTH